MIEMDNNINETDNMSIHHTSILGIILGNIKWLMIFLFAPAVNVVQNIVPEWKGELENFKLIGGAVIVVLVITKLILEIIKLVKKK